MRLAAYIMAFLVLALSCLPCTDEGTGGAGEEKVQVTALSHAQNDHSDACSPFCHCACCAIFSIDHHVTELAIYTPQYIVSYNYPVPAKIAEISFPVWQPPQIA